MKTITRALVGLIASACCLSGCSKSEAETDALANLIITLPATLNAGVGEEITCNFVSGCGPITGDYLVFQGSGSNSHRATINSIAKTSFKFNLPDMASGKYAVSLFRGEASRQLRSGVNVTIIDRSVKYCSKETAISDGIIYSTCCGSATTSVQQGFDFTSDDDYVYFSQVHSKGLNTIGWGPRKQLTSSFDVLPNKITFKFFSHGNNIYIEKEGSDRYVWIGNYSSRGSDNAYHNPQIVSRVKLEKGKMIYNTQTTDNYYFGIVNGHQSIDWKNRLFAIYSAGKVNVYKLDEVKQAPVKAIQLAESITYGGGTSTDPEYKGYVTVNAHDCRNLAPIYSFSYSYANRGIGWQTYCISDGKAYFFMTLSPTENGYKYESIIEVVDMATGKMLCSKVKQPFSSNMQSFYDYGFTDAANKYVENEAIVVRDGKLYLSYTCIITKPNASFSVDPRRPVVFVFDAEDPAFK